MTTAAAIYARKSTEQTGVADEQRSVARQIANARAFATARGWTVRDEWVFVDDGISGAEFERRPGFQKLMAMLSPRAPFQLLIVSEQKSLGREQFETGYAIKRLSEAGVEIFEYLTGTSLTPKNWTEKMMSSFRAGADEAHSQQTSTRVKESHTKKAKQGHVVGGRVYGYRNEQHYNGTDAHGRPLKSHVARVVYEPEAAVVRRIFDMYNAGAGLKTIAKLLSLDPDNAPPPLPFNRKNVETAMRCPPPNTRWAPSTVRSILTREMYRGVQVWNKTRKRNDWMKVERSRRNRQRPESEWMRIPADHLRIVSDDVWMHAASRRADTEGRTLRFSDGRMTGRPPKQLTQNLLAGLSTCGVCGGGLCVETSPRKRGRIPEYICSRRRVNGTCSNALRLPVVEMNEAVLHAIEEHALTPEAVELVVRLTERDDYRDHQERLNLEMADVARKITRLVDAITDGADSAALRTKLRELEAKQTELRREAKELRPVPRLPRTLVENRLAEWRRLLRQSTEQGRAVLQRVLSGRIVFKPNAEGTGYDFVAPTRFDRLFTGIAVPSTAPDWMPTVMHTEIGPDDTLDGDYGRLLAGATAIYAKRVASPTGFEPVFWP